MCVSSDLSLLPQVLSAYASVVEQTAKANQLTTMNSRLRRSFGEAGAQTDQCVEWLREYCQAFFYGLSVKLLPAVTVAETKCSFRVNSDSHNLQILTAPPKVTCYSSCGVGNQAFCIVGITMINLYPKDSWNFVFGQASLSNEMGVFSFSRYDDSFYSSSYAGSVTTPPHH
ncbi:hypothetical protein NQZ68_035935 [Dissostichus eleginoides]|nr:hypothetical protein NQZ68_035935 [Dissostichus eleginoides]